MMPPFPSSATEAPCRRLGTSIASNPPGIGSVGSAGPHSPSPDPPRDVNVVVCQNFLLPRHDDRVVAAKVGPGVERWEGRVRHDGRLRRGFDAKNRRTEGDGFVWSCGDRPPPSRIRPH
eukprot:scaffold3608_cov183-Amphora_coffeaeformis.AAC.23